MGQQRRDDELKKRMARIDDPWLSVRQTAMHAGVCEKPSAALTCRGRCSTRASVAPCASVGHGSTTGSSRPRSCRSGSRRRCPIVAPALSAVKAHREAATRKRASALTAAARRGPIGIYRRWRSFRLRVSRFRRWESHQAKQQGRRRERARMRVRPCSAGLCRVRPAGGD
jgi:hypothetical protein